MDIPHSEQGFGIDLDGAYWRLDAPEMLFREIRSGFTPHLEELVDGFIQSFGDDYDDEQELAEDFVSNYENDQTYWGGLEGLVADYLSERLFEDREIFQYHYSCLYVEADIIGNSAYGNLTQDDIANIFEEWVYPYLQEPVEVDWHRITFA